MVVLAPLSFLLWPLWLRWGELSHYFSMWPLLTPWMGGVRYSWKVVKVLPSHSAFSDTTVAWRRSALLLLGRDGKASPCSLYWHHREKELIINCQRWKSRFSQLLACWWGKGGATVFSWCLIGVGGYCLKRVPVLLSYPFPSPLATESWLFLRAIFFDIPRLVVSLLLTLGCIKYIPHYQRFHFLCFQLPTANHSLKILDRKFQK